LTIRNGSAYYSEISGSSGDGGGIYNSNGTLTISNSTVIGNVANGGRAPCFPHIAMVEVAAASTAAAR
jgi:hypothetical protein